MATTAKNYSTTDVGAFAQLAEKGRTELHDALALTGSEISLNSLPAGKASSFLHTHKLNEEVYIVLSGNGTFQVDGDVIPLQEGSVVRVDPAGVRAINAGDAGLVYICIQAQQGSLTQWTMNDGVIQP